MKFILGKFSFILLPIFVLNACIAGNSSVNKQRDLRSLTAIISNPTVTGRQALAICKPQAELAKSQATSGASSSSRVNCTKTILGVSCDNGPSNKWEALGDALAESRAGKGAYNAVLDSCLAQHGWQ